MTRDKIIAHITAAIEPLPYTHALWLEGADGSETVDEYSDLDFWLDFDDEYETQIISAVETALENLAPIDYKYIMEHPHPKIRQRIYHLGGTSKYLMIDFCWQLHSHDEGMYIRDNKIEAAKILFDKSNVIRYKDYDPSDFASHNAAFLEKCMYRFTQHSRILKYVRRNRYAEALASYHHYVIEPMVGVLRLLHTPAHVDYHLTHISQHIPENELKLLEYFLRVATIDDIENKTHVSLPWFKGLVGML